MSETDDIGYAVVVAFWDKADLPANLDRDLLWRQKSMRAPRQQRLAGVTEIEYVQVIPDVVVDPGRFDANYSSGAFIARCVSREPRGM